MLFSNPERLVQRMLADDVDFVVGVDPHRDRNAVAFVRSPSGQVVFEASASASTDGYEEVLRLAGEHAPGRRVFAIEGTGSYGKGLSRFLLEQGERVVEVGRVKRDRRSGAKSDPLDAIRAARSALAAEKPAQPRSRWSTRSPTRVDGRTRGCTERETRRTLPASAT